MSSSRGDDLPKIDAIRAALGLILDPELGVDIVSLGLVYAVQINADGVVEILMTTTMRGCPASQFLVDAARQAVANVAGVTRADIELTFEPAWQPGMACAEVQARF